MARGKRLTGHKLTRAESALRDLLDCEDVEYRRQLDAALRAVQANGRWHAEEVAAGRVSDDDGPEPLPLPSLNGHAETVTL